MTFDTLRTIAERFPCLQGRIAATDSPDVALAAIAQNVSNSKGIRHAARFCLHLWDSRNPFELVAAYTSWDNESRGAYRAGLEQAFG